MINIQGQYKGYELKPSSNRTVVIVYVNPYKAEAPNLPITFIGEEAEALVEQVLDALPENTSVRITARIRTREYQGRVFADLQGVNLVPSSETLQPVVEGVLIGQLINPTPIEGRKGTFYRYDLVSPFLAHPLSVTVSDQVDPELLYRVELFVRTREYQGRVYTDYSVQKYAPSGLRVKAAELTEAVPF